MSRLWIYTCVMFLVLTTLTACGKKKEETELSTGDASKTKCGSMRDFSVSVTPSSASSVSASSIQLQVKDSAGKTLNVSRSPKDDFISFTGKISSSLKYQFRILSNGSVVHQSEIIDPLKEPTFQGCAVSRSCTYESGKWVCATPV